MALTSSRIYLLFLLYITFPKNVIWPSLFKLKCTFQETLFHFIFECILLLHLLPLFFGNPVIHKVYLIHLPSIPIISSTGMCAKSFQLCLTLCDPMDCSPPGFSIHEVLQAGILEWVAVSSSKASSRPRNWTCVCYMSTLAGGFFTTNATVIFTSLLIFLFFCRISLNQFGVMCFCC